MFHHLKSQLWGHLDRETKEVPLCTRCSMPVGQFAYEGREGRRSWVHAECMAQVLVEDAQRHEDRRALWEAEKKLKSRKEYEIGWRMDSIPENAALAERIWDSKSSFGLWSLLSFAIPSICCLQNMLFNSGMGCNTTAPGLCCLVLDEASKTVKAPEQNTCIDSEFCKVRN